MKTEEITKELERGVKELLASDKYKEYLNFMGKFHDYSVNNSILIFLQMPQATMVAGYQAWQNKFKRQVRKGEKAIRILAPCPHKYTKQIEDENGNKEEHEFNWTTFRPVSVFDISQTDGDEIPEICNDLTGNVEGYKELIEKLIAVSPVRVSFEPINSAAKGYFNDAENKIVVKDGMSEEQTVKTLVHEIAHSLLHGKEGEETEANRNTKEVQAESVAYTVCRMLGLNTDEYSFGYIAGWSAGKELKELNQSMEAIRKTANKIMEGIKNEN